MSSTSTRPATVHPLEGFLGYQLRRASTHMQADLARRIGELGLTIVEMSALLVIEANRGVTQSEIGRMIAIKRANMAPLAARLIGRGLVEASPVDGRSNGLALTEAGEGIASRIHAHVADNEALLFAGIPPQDRARVIALVRLIWAGS